MSGFNDSDFKRLLEIIDRTENERKSGSDVMASEKDVIGDYSESYERVVSGLIFAGDAPELIYGNVYTENGLIKEIEPVRSAQEISPNWIVPRFVNAHTHIGDALLKDPSLGPAISQHAYARDLDALVRPPNGLKHKFLSSLSFDDAVSSMESAILEMYQSGISIFADFREGGIAGVSALSEASKNAARDIHPVIFGRPASFSIDFLDELREILEITDGIGVSGANDLDDYSLSKMSSKTQSKRKKLAIHAGEKDRSDIDSAFSVSPDLMIHMTHASKTDLQRAADADIPICVCIRSNLTTGVGCPPVSDMLDAGIRVCVGTDNVMLNAPDMFEELHFLSKICGITDASLFKMATTVGADALGCRFTGSIDVGMKADMMILNSKSLNLKNIKDPLAGFVRRARIDDILGIV